MFTKRAAFVLALVLACAFLISVAAQADVQYIFPESNTRELTWDEVEAWNNEALHIGFNEIWARYGYKFIPGGACDRWFSQQEWYHPITSGTNEKNVLPKASGIGDCEMTSLSSYFSERILPPAPVSMVAERCPVFISRMAGGKMMR